MSYETARQSVARWGRLLGQVLLPCPCLGCGREVEDPRAFGLCDGCTARLVPASPGSCWSCGRLIPGQVPAEPRCGSCRKRRPPWDRLVWVWLYRPPLDAVIAGMKFRRLDYLADRLGREMARRLHPLTAGFDAVVPVPLHWTRRITRGYDQAELLSRAMAETLDRPLWPALRRRRRTPPQSDHNRARRRENLRRAFEARHSLDGRRLLLVDDVLTTGATLEAAVRALRRAGTASVTVATVARTPHPSELNAGAKPMRRS